MTFIGFVKFKLSSRKGRRSGKTSTASPRSSSRRTFISRSSGTKSSSSRTSSAISLLKTSYELLDIHGKYKPIKQPKQPKKSKPPSKASSISLSLPRLKLVKHRGSYNLFPRKKSSNNRRTQKSTQPEPFQFNQDNSQDTPETTTGQGPERDTIPSIRWPFLNTTADEDDDNENETEGSEPPTSFPTSLYSHTSGNVVTRGAVARGRPTLVHAAALGGECATLVDEDDPESFEILEANHRAAQQRTHEIPDAEAPEPPKQLSRAVVEAARRDAAVHEWRWRLWW
ncbi:hypothetical protein JX265_006915 [Neoarthrinium moseri]|uniref:Uncharacterized protein n=1 Tax=Neoarthrinium moseri TaxID=1658444 RepID=A0A9P9WLJ1_9PEZI|nr:hypothetical protein JX265_006915 [Neoarthrinium moseri]